MFVAATIVGLAAYMLLFMGTITGANTWLLIVLAGKAIVAACGGYVADRPLRLPRRSRWMLFAAYEIGPLLMTLWGLGDFVASGNVGFSPSLWWLVSLPDLLAGRIGIVAAKRVDSSLPVAG